MSGSFSITLDTTSPTIQVFAPDYTTNESFVEILVSADEILSVDQDFYIIDSAGMRHDLIFDYVGDHFIGQVNFNDYPLGIATFYAQVKDTVFNLSNVANHSIKISEKANILVAVSHKARRTIIQQTGSKVIAASNSRSIYTEEKSRKIGVNEENV